MGRELDVSIPAASIGLAVKLGGKVGELGRAEGQGGLKSRLSCWCSA